MSQSYVKECIFCKAKIRMSDREGKWLPYNENDSQHDCKKKEQVAVVSKSDTEYLIESTQQAIDTLLNIKKSLEQKLKRDRKQNG